MAESTNTTLTREEIQMKDFVTLYGIEGLYIICVQSGGEGAKLAPSTLVSALTTSIKPSISDSGYWFIGSTETGVLARAKTPLLTVDGSILQWKYEGEPDEMLRVLADLANYVFKFEDLTPEQRDSISLHFSQLTEAEIAQLQQPAKDMIAQLSETNKEATAAEETRQRNEETRQSQEAKRQTDTATAISNSESATGKALEVASNPTYIGTDMYVYEYDLATHTFNKTDKAMKIHFKIEYVYSSVAELEADQPVGKMDGLFAIISSNTEDPDNAKLYTSKSGKWVYLTDMSGFRGFRGFTPQLSIGTITFGSNRTDAAVSLSENGTDEEGNPRYLINLRIPSFAYSDFTPEQIAELQKPATDKAAEVQAAENKRVAAEKARVEAEKARVQEHTTKMGEATTATSNANSAAASAAEEAGKAASAADNANAKAEVAQTAADNANEKAALAQEAADNANTKATLAQEAASLATEKAGVAQSAANSVDESKAAALSAADNANAKAEVAQTAANNANAKAKAAEDAASLAIARASDAQTAAETANAAAANTNAIIDTANDKIAAAEEATALANEKAALADTKASAAQEAATLANDKAGIAQAAADNANTKAELAQSAADNANTKSEVAQTAADNANAKAALAQEAADNANTNATLAQAAASLATDKASVAETAANFATDKASVAQTAADNANAKAEVAQTAADNANEKAALAQSAANSVNESKTAALEAAALATEKAGVAQAAADSVDAAIAKVNNFETRLGNVETGKQDDVTKLEEVSEVDYVIGVKDGAAKRISKNNISVETELNGMAWGIILNPNSANAELSVVGNYALWTEFKESIGRYQMNNSGKAIKLHPLDSSKYIDGTDIDTSKGHIMVHVPDLYYKVVEQSNGNSILWMSARPIGGHAIHTSGEGNGSWIGAYIGREVDGALVSKPSLNPTRSKTISSFFATAQVNGPDFGLSDYEHRQLMMMLYLSEYHNENSQACLGYGMNGNAGNWVAGVYNALTGETASLGDGCGSVAFHSDDEVTANACHISLFGIEDPYGWYWEMIQGCYFGNSGNEAQTGSEMFVYKGNRMPTSDELTTQPSGAFRQLTRPTSSGNVYALQMGDHFDVLPGKLGSGGWSDYHWANTTGQLLLWGGSAYDGSRCGLACSYSNSAFSFADSNGAARLAYYGVATVVSRPTEL